MKVIFVKTGKDVISIISNSIMKSNYSPTTCPIKYIDVDAGAIIFILPLFV